jgi:hypothetical protein
LKLLNHKCSENVLKEIKINSVIVVCTDHRSNWNEDECRTTEQQNALWHTRLGKGEVGKTTEEITRNCDSTHGLIPDRIIVLIYYYFIIDIWAVALAIKRIKV